MSCNSAASNRFFNEKAFEFIWLPKKKCGDEPYHSLNVSFYRQTTLTILHHRNTLTDENEKNSQRCIVSKGKYQLKLKSLTNT
jgi:hypothetical protein